MVFRQSEEIKRDFEMITLNENNFNYINENLCQCSDNAFSD